MRNIKTSDGFAVVFDHDYPFHSGSGLVSEYHFDSPRFYGAVEKLFECKENEMIVAVEITRTGMKAYFEYKPEEASAQKRKKRRHGRTRH